MIMSKEKTILFVFGRISNDFPKIKALVRDKGFILRPALVKETFINRPRLAQIIKHFPNQPDSLAASVLTKAPIKTVLLEKENAVKDLVSFVGPNNIIEAPLGTLIKLFGEYTVACPCDEEHVKSLMYVFYPEVSM